MSEQTITKEQYLNQLAAKAADRIVDYVATFGEDVMEYRFLLVRGAQETIVEELTPLLELIK